MDPAAFVAIASGVAAIITAVTALIAQIQHSRNPQAHQQAGPDQPAK